ncbi:hypothetical protein MLD38_040704 [Melastoma candidum]|nr:hypothetical protein MLD38_040704 [Melastoma candidum]
MAGSSGNYGMNLMRLAEEKACEKKAKAEERQRSIPYLPKDCAANVLIRLPHESLQRSMAVCRCWRDIARSLNFVDSYLRRAESVLVFRTRSQVEQPLFGHVGSLPAKKTNTFSVEQRLFELRNMPLLWQPIAHPRAKFYIKYLCLGDGEGEIKEYNISCQGRILATCNGLILLENVMKKGGLLVLNPVTRKLVALPVGTLYPNHRESYGFAFNEISGDYKVVHLFRDELEYVNCEVLDLKTKIWRGVNGPTSGQLDWLGYNPVSAIHSLHWIPQIDQSDYIVSMEVGTEKFQTVPLPQSCRTYDRILEIHGCLGFIAHVNMNHIGVWLLKGLCRDSRWEKAHSITVTTTFDMVAICSLRVKGDLVLEREEDHSLFSYDFQQERLRKMETEQEYAACKGSRLAHVNSFISW